MIAFTHVTHGYGDKTVLHDVNVSIEPKEFLTIVGASGSGKSALVRLMMRMEDPADGQITVDGVSLGALPQPILQLFRSRTGVIFQDPILIEHATVAENIALPLELRGAPSALIRRNVSDLLTRLKLSDRANALPRELTHAQRALTGIARALITGPVILLADEPFAALDETQRAIVLDLFNNMHKRGATIVILTQDHLLADVLPGKTVELQNGTIAQKKRATKEESPLSVKTTHRLLEEDELPLSRFEEASSVFAPSPEKPGRGGKKIRITSIGSNL